MIYVDQFGNPVQAPNVTNIQYVPQAQPQQIIVNNTTENQQSTTMDQKKAASNQCQRCSSCVLGVIALAMLICGLYVSTLAARTYDDYDWIVTCGFNNYKIITDDDSLTISYNDLCDAYDDDDDYDDD